MLAVDSMGLGAGHVRQEHNMHAFTSTDSVSLLHSHMPLDNSTACCDSFRYCWTA